MRRRLYKSAAAPMLHSGTDRDEFNVVCRFKPDLPNQTDSNAALLPYYSSVTYMNGVAFRTGLSKQMTD